MVTINELVEEMSRDGYKLTPRTIKYYIQRGLLPGSEKQGGYKEGVKLFFPNKEETLLKLRDIFQLKGKGYKLSEIYDYFETEKRKNVAKRYRAYLKSFILINGIYVKDISVKEIEEDSHRILAKNLKEFANKWNSFSFWEKYKIANIDFREIEQRKLFQPLFYYQGTFYWEEMDGMLLRPLTVLHNEYELSWSTLEDLYKRNRENIDHYICLPEIDNIRFTHEWVQWKKVDFERELWSNLTGYIKKIKNDSFNDHSEYDFDGQPIWDSKYDDFNSFLDDFIEGKCAFVPTINGGEFFLKRF